MPEITQFRTALNGYHREDVVSFIDQMTREHEDALKQLQEKNMQLNSRVQELEEALAAAEADAGSKQALAEANNLLEELRARNEELEAELRELDSLTQGEAARSEEIKPMASANTQDLDAPMPAVSQVLPVELAPSKDFTELELAAYRRAELAERMARERAGDVYRQIQSVFNQANTKLGSGKSDLEQLSKALNTDLNQLLILLTNLNSTYQSAEASFAELGEQNRKILEGEE